MANFFNLTLIFAFAAVFSTMAVAQNTAALQGPAAVKGPAALTGPGNLAAIPFGCWGKCGERTTCVKGKCIGEECCPEGQELVNGKCDSQKCPITNVCFVVDQSGSINNSEYDKEKDFVIGIATAIKGTSPGAQLSAWAFSTTVAEIQAPTPNLSVFTASINGPRDFNAATNIGLGLKACRETLDPLPGKRIVVLVTDGVASNPANAVTEADLIKTTPGGGMFLATVGIDLSQNAEDFLRDSIAQGPEFALESSFTDLEENVKDMTDLICRLSKVKVAGCRESCKAKGIACKKGTSCVGGKCVGKICCPRGQISKNGKCISAIASLQASEHRAAVAKASSE